jgi:hypothetical protein
MTVLRDIAKVIRSKNAGPFLLTFDVLMSSKPDYDRVMESSVFDHRNIEDLLGLEANTVMVYPCPAAYAIKLTTRRAVPAGSVDDRDLYGAQQHTWLFDLEIE